MSGLIDESLLDDPAALEAADPAGMLRVVAGSGAQVREAAAYVAEVDLDAVTGERPRAIVLSSVGSSAAACEVLAAVVGDLAPIPIVPVPGPALPRWAGPLDLVVAVSRSGTARATVDLAAEAGRRGCRLVTIGGAGTPLADVSDRFRGIHLPTDRAARHTRSSLWSLAVPLLAIAGAAGAAGAAGVVDAAAFDAVADRLDSVAEACRPSSDTFVNPAKALALDIAGSMPLVWGGGRVGAAAARRFARQLEANAKYPSCAGALEDVAHGGVAVLDGVFVASDPGAALFADPLADADDDRPLMPLRVVIVRDGGADGDETALVAAVTEVARDRGVRVSELGCDDGEPLGRLASLVVLGDFASVYLALGLRLDPAPTRAVLEVKDRVGRRGGRGERDR